MIPPTICNEHGERIAFTHTPGSGDDIVVLGHGVTSDKERPWSEALSDALAAHGIATLRIAFSGNGDSEGSFADSTITKEVADLGAVFDALDGKRICYVGHSMGGAVGALRAVTDERIHCLVSLAAIAHTHEFIVRVFGNLSEGDAMLDKPHCPFSLALRDDLTQIDSLVSQAPNIRIPWLLVHGTEDVIVPFTHSRDMLAAAGWNASLVVLDGVDHSFTEDGMPQMLESVVPWLVEQLDAESA
jgi:uncharacterized protein